MTKKTMGQRMSPSGQATYGATHGAISGAISGSMPASLARPTNSSRGACPQCPRGIGSPQCQRSQGDQIVCPVEGCAQPWTMPALRESGLSQARAPRHERSNRNQHFKPSNPQPVARKVPHASTQLILALACAEALTADAQDLES